MVVTRGKNCVATVFLEKSRSKRSKRKLATQLEIISCKQMAVPRF